MMRIERMTSPLPRECSTTEPHGQGSGAGEGNRTLVGGLKAPALPLSYTRSFEDYIIPPRGTFLLNCCNSIAGGGDGFEPS